jgi:hypothetical protein
VDDVTILLSYFQATIAALFPALPAPILTKNAARDGKQREGGYAEGFNITGGAFVVSCCEGDIIDKGAATFEVISRQYPVIVEYVKRLANASTVTAPGSAPAEILEDPDVRQKRTELINNLFIMTTTAVPNMYDVRPPRMGKTYSLTADTKTIMISPTTYLCTLINPRPGA